MKNATTRMSETIAWIVQQVPPAEGRAVKASLEAWPLTAAPLAKELSEETMHLGRVGTGDERSLRRAALLLAAIVNVDGVRIKRLPLQVLRREFARILYRFRLGADQASAQPTGLLTRVFERELRPHPEAFLRDNKLKINGVTTVKGEDNVHDFHFFYGMLDDRFEISGGAPTPLVSGAHPFQAVSIPPVDWKAVPGRGTAETTGSFAAIAGTKMGGTTVAVTTQFTGCSLCLKETGGQLYAAHISPSNTKGAGQERGPTTMAKQLAGRPEGVTGGDFANAGGVGDFKVYGMGYSNIPGCTAGYPTRTSRDDMMTIIGFHDTGWKVFSQHIVQRRITKVERIL